jgi:3-phenylpropionate/trans-cinnamate dioxygenase ferredoxin reductase subunit
LDKPKRYAEVPWFWSDQYKTKLQMAGLVLPGDVPVIRGDPAVGRFAVFHLRHQRVTAVEAINSIPEYMAGRKMIAVQKEISSDRLADVATLIKELM